MVAPGGMPGPCRLRQIRSGELGSHPRWQIGHRRRGAESAREGLIWARGTHSRAGALGPDWSGKRKRADDRYAAQQQHRSAAREADQDRRQGRQPRSLGHAPDRRGRGAAAHVCGDLVAHRTATGAARSGMTAAVSDEIDDEGRGVPG